MSKVVFNIDKEIGKIKIMHAVNNGPVVAGPDQTRGNEPEYKAARIPFARTHDAAFFSGYGGSHTVDVHAIFPDFNADENDPASYDFACTDNYMKQIIDCGTKPFYRLGSKIEHEVKKYGTLVPKDFAKWARICEHIIAHYNEGWADGFEYGIEYWEIWNEPDLDTDDSKNKRCWGGTEAQFAEMFIIAATHLKNRFPTLKIGGPSSAGDESWMDRFLERIKKANTSLDFLSWHWYWIEPYDMSIKGTRIRKLLEKHGYESAESIMNEWNYVRCWTKEFVYSIEQIIGIKGAAFTAACMSAAQHNPDIDMLMYYDARPTAFNGLFDLYTYRTLKGYYPFYIFANLYELGNQMESVSDDEDVYAVCAKKGDNVEIMLTYYAEDDNKYSKIIDIDFGGYDMTGARFFLTDASHTMIEKRLEIVDGKMNIRLERNSILYIEKK